jgi:hypothetical protein
LEQSPWQHTRIVAEPLDPVVLTTHLQKFREDMTLP